jgi:hypothetical protein
VGTVNLEHNVKHSNYRGIIKFELKEMGKCNIAIVMLTWISFIFTTATKFGQDKVSNEGICDASGETDHHSALCGNPKLHQKH